jgi:hypothetical protein
MMTEPASAASRPEPRRIACGRCGAVFECRLSGGCWCAGEAFRLPLPPAGEDCLCAACLRAEAERQMRQTQLGRTV